MLNCIFTLDYEIYGNGEGSLRDLVVDPTHRLAQIFREFGSPFVVFPECLEFARMEAAQSDADTARVRDQLRELQSVGHEIALHIHPWWADARYESGKWHLNWSERNICTLHPDRIEAIVLESIQYLRDALKDPSFTPLSFRSGLWVMQPTEWIADVLARNGIRVDSSVYKGGLVESLGLDYRPSFKNGAFWQFSTDVNTPVTQGLLWEIPIYTQMVPFWKMLGGKRLKLQKRVPSAVNGMPLPRRLRDFVRLRYPRKLDFCRMTFKEMRQVIELVLRECRMRRDEPQIIVAIGHSKDLVDSEAIRRFLDFLQQKSIVVTTFSRLFYQEPRFSL
jgi:hypothetical protein